MWHARLQLVDAQGCPKNRGSGHDRQEVRDSGVFYISDEPRQLTGAEVPLGVDRVLLYFSEFRIPRTHIYSQATGRGVKSLCNNNLDFLTSDFTHDNPRIRP